MKKIIGAVFRTSCALLFYSPSYKHKLLYKQCWER